MRLPASVLLYLFEVQQSVDLERRAAATDDGFWSALGVNGTEGFQALQKRIAALEALAAGQAPASLEAPGAIQL